MNIERKDFSDIAPLASSFSLSSTGKTYTLRKVSIWDFEWMVKEFGGIEAAQKAVENFDIDKILKFVVRLLSEEDKKDFAARDCTYFDEATGEQTKGRIGGAKLFKEMVASVEELESIAMAVVQDIRDSQPKLAEKMDEAMLSKKKESSPAIPTSGTLTLNT